MAQTVKRLPAMRETRLQSLGWEDPWRRKWQPTPVPYLENPMDGGAWEATIHGGRKESDTTELLHFCILPTLNPFFFCFMSVRFFSNQSLKIPKFFSTLEREVECPQVDRF